MSMLSMALPPPNVSVPAPVLNKLLPEVMPPPRLRFPLVGVKMVSSAFQAMLRLTVCVMGAAGFPLKPILPFNAMLLPSRVNAPAAESNVMLLAVMLERSLLFTNCVEPVKVKPMGKMGTAFWFQLSAVLQLLFAPSPVQIPVLILLDTTKLPDPVMNPGRLLL